MIHLLIPFCCFLQFTVDSTTIALFLERLRCHIPVAPVGQVVEETNNNIWVKRGSTWRLSENPHEESGIIDEQCAGGSSGANINMSYLSRESEENPIPVLCRPTSGDDDGFLEQVDDVSNKYGKATLTTSHSILTGPSYSDTHKAEDDCFLEQVDDVSNRYRKLTSSHAVLTAKGPSCSDTHKHDKASQSKQSPFQSKQSPSQSKRSPFQSKQSPSLSKQSPLVKSSPGLSLHSESPNISLVPYAASPDLSAASKGCQENMMQPATESASCLPQGMLPALNPNSVRLGLSEGDWELGSGMEMKAPEESGDLDEDWDVLSLYEYDTLLETDDSSSTARPVAPRHVADPVSSLEHEKQDQNLGSKQDEPLQQTGGSTERQFEIQATR
jgi:hypothetical protein